jgi:pimeloyl-ACP methyl ester carboxylesterase
MFLHRSIILSLLSALFWLPSSGTAEPAPARRLPPPGIEISATDRAELAQGVAALRREIDELTRKLAAPSTSRLAALLPDVEVLHKAVDWALRFDEFFEPKQIALARQLLVTGHERAAALARGEAPWLDATGLVVRGHRSAIDGSIQPYGLLVPTSVRRDRPNRLMVWLLGRGEKRSELAFIAERQTTAPQLTPRDTLIVIPYGRFCNATKFAGEVDVFEAMAAAGTTYAVDADRVIVAGFSMGGASTWHLAVHHAGLWCAAAPGAGFAEAAVYTNAFAPGKKPPTSWEQLLWHQYNATDYAANLFNLPTIAYSGEIDKQKQAAEIMAAAMKAEGLELPHLIGPQTGHAYHPETKKELTRRIEELADRGRDARPAELHVTTYTLRYPGESWARFEGLEHHWQRADLVAKRDRDKVTLTTRNTRAVRLDIPGVRSVTVDGQPVTLAASTSPIVVLHRDGGTWKPGPGNGLGKKPRLSGPIDDAFMESFVHVRPTGQAWNAAVGTWARGELGAAIKLWRDLFRGEAPVIDDTALTESDIAARNLILWGDPASNAVLRRILGRLPLTWTDKVLEFRGQKYEAGHHAPILIFPNPLNPDRYVVLNSGIDFRDHAYGTNALQIPKLPDYGIVDLNEAPGPRWPGKIVTAGFFDEDWK